MLAFIPRNAFTYGVAAGETTVIGLPRHALKGSTYYLVVKEAFIGDNGADGLGPCGECE